MNQNLEQSYSTEKHFAYEFMTSKDIALAVKFKDYSKIFSVVVDVEELETIDA